MFGYLKPNSMVLHSVIILGRVRGLCAASRVKSKQAVCDVSIPPAEQINFFGTLVVNAVKTQYLITCTTSAFYFF